jgi:hypothetical protein
MSETDRITVRRAHDAQMGQRHKNLARQLRVRREAAGISGRVLAGRCGWPESKVPKLANLSIGVIAANRYLPVIPMHTYTLHAYPERSEVFVETVGSEIVVTSEWELGKYRQHFDEVKAAALTGGDARNHLAQIADDYRNRSNDE